MPELRVHRSPWRDFPDVIVQTTVNKLRSRAAYDQAKRGLGEAAFEVIQELFRPEKIQFDFDTVVPVMQFDRAYPNALPIALAKHGPSFLVCIPPRDLAATERHTSPQEYAEEPALCFWRGCTVTCQSFAN